MDSVSPTPSRTALSVALRRAAHQLYDRPLVFDDPLAVSILGSAYAAALQKTPNPAPGQKQRVSSVAMRAHVVARSCFAEETLAEAIASPRPITPAGRNETVTSAECMTTRQSKSGATQYVLLGAGLDTFAHRNPYAGLRVFEVDHPATQAWKRTLLADARLPEPDRLTYAPVDFERGSLRGPLTGPLRAGLARAGFDFEAKTVFAWLGVVPYLTIEAFRATVGLIAAMPGGSAVIFDYGQPRDVLDPREQLERDSLATRVAAVGEPFQLFFTPQDVSAELSGFARIEDLGATELNDRYFAGRSDHLALRGAAGRFVRAWCPEPPPRR